MKSFKYVGHYSFLLSVLRASVVRIFNARTCESDFRLLRTRGPFSRPEDGLLDHFGQGYEFLRYFEVEPVSLEALNDWTPALTANRPVNAIPYVCAARPGILSTLDLPHITPAGPSVDTRR